IFDPFLTHSWGWMGWHPPHDVNNWNIWINSNILKAAMMTLRNETHFAAVLNRTLYSADYFLNNYGQDGGCNEGPSYWREAGGRLIEYVESLVELFNAKEYFKQVKLVKAIGDYTYKLHIDRNWFVNFADASPVINYPPSLLAKYGVLFNDREMAGFA